MAEFGRRRGLKPLGSLGACGFESHSGHGARFASTDAARRLLCSVARPLGKLFLWRPAEPYNLRRLHCAQRSGAEAPHLVVDPDSHHTEEEGLMAPSDMQRLRLRERLAQVLNEEHAVTLMESLPPVAWDQLATKDDLVALEARMNAKFDGFRAEMLARFDNERLDVHSRIDTGLTSVRSRIETGLADVHGKIETGLAEVHGKIDAGLAEVHGKIDTGLTEVRGKIETGLTDVHSRIETGLADVHSKIDTGLTEVRSRIETGLAEIRGEIAKLGGESKRDMARQTFVILAAIAAVITPIYLAMFNGTGA